MKKILLAFDSANFSEGAFEFVRCLNEIQPVLVTGVFVAQVDYATLWGYAAAVEVGAVYYPAVLDDEPEILKNIERFEHLCQINGISYRVHKNFLDPAIPELKKETRFADVVIFSGELFYKGVILNNHFAYLKGALHATECPVLIVPEEYEFPDNNILAYDGSEESVFAIKQFTYVFPELAKNKTLLVYTNDKEGSDFPSKENIIELATQHFKDLTLHKIGSDSKKYFGSWVGNKKGSILVSGSFGRSGVSEIFKKSFVADIIRDHKVPVFIAHK